MMIRDDHFSYHWLFAFERTLTENVGRAIIDWCADFGVPICLLSDGTTHFRSKTLCLVCKGLKVLLKISLAYTPPRSNGSVKRLEKELLRVFSSVKSELCLRSAEWPDILPLIQSVLNNSPPPQRAGIFPLKAITGLEPTTPIGTLYRSSVASTVTLENLTLERAINMERLSKVGSEIRPFVQRAQNDNRERKSSQFGKRQVPNFTEGDFVLVARKVFFAGKTASLHWRDRRHIVCLVNDCVYEMKDLRTGLTDEVHTTRLKLYHDPSLDVEAVIPHFLSSETGMEVQYLMHLYEPDDGLMVEVRWRGLPPVKDTDECLQKIYEDILDQVRKLSSRRSTIEDLSEKARLELDI